MEGGEWSSFNGVYVNEEADFMAQLFPTNTSLTANNVADGGSGLACWSNTFNMPTGSVYASSETTANSNLYCSFSQESCYSGGNGIVEYPTAGQENFYVCDDNSHQFLAANNNNGALIEFRDDIVGGEDCIHEQMEESGEVEHGDSKNFLPKRGSEMSLELEDKISDSSEIPRKRARASDVPKGKRSANKSRKRQKASVVDEDDNAGLTRPSSSTCSSEDESNLSLQLNNGGSPSSSALNLNGKTRASRGSATDPQSLYARKRRERINERLKILQKLVPNGTKVDISTMLEEAVLYVKFLQLQIKLLSSDDTWMYAPIAYNGMDIGLDLNINARRS